MKISLFAGLALSAAALAGCTSTGSLTPSASSSVTTAFNMICPNIQALAPVAAQMNAKAQSAYASASAICAAGVPTNAVVAGLDLVTIMNSAVLQPYLAKIKIGG